MFENAVYSILSPEGFSSILFKDTSKVKDVCELMKLTSYDLLEKNIIDEIIEEPLGGIKHLDEKFISSLRKKLVKKIKHLQGLNKNELLENRYLKYRRIGS
jgi:acetyl-CoA carboxylase carboxyl transferase subunit alpha